MSDSCDSWRDWLTRHGPALVLFARQWSADRAMAEDAVQEALLKVWKARTRLDDPLAALFTTVKRAALDGIRTGKRRIYRESLTARPEALFVQHDDPNDALTQALAMLPDEQREVVVMRVWGGLTVPQIATSLGISENTVSSRYRYALGKLRTLLAEEDQP